MASNARLTNFPAFQRFPRNNWYVAAACCEVSRKILARQVNGEKIVLYRSEGGKVVALRDACPHKGFPLSQSVLIGDDIRCGYHGMRFNSGGQCTNIPSQPTIPRSMCVRAFVVVEKWLLVWIWTGDPQLADETTIPDFGFESKVCEDVQFIFSGQAGCNAQLLIDNLLDLTHLSFLHQGEFDTDPDQEEDGGEIARTPLHVERAGNVVRAWRAMPRFVCNEIGIATMLGVPMGTVAYRLTDTRAVPRSGYVIGRSLFTDADNHDIVLADTVTAAIVTPVDLKTSWHTVLWCTTYKQAPELKASVCRVIGQDLAVLPAIQCYFDEHADAHEVSVTADKAAILARRMVAEALGAEDEGR